MNSVTQTQASGEEQPSEEQHLKTLLQEKLIKYEPSPALVSVIQTQAKGSHDA